MSRRRVEKGWGLLLRGLVAKIEIPIVIYDSVGVTTGIGEEGTGQIERFQDFLRHQVREGRSGDVLNSVGEELERHVGVVWCPVRGGQGPSL